MLTKVLPSSPRPTFNNTPAIPTLALYLLTTWKPVWCLYSTISSCNRCIRSSLRGHCLKASLKPYSQNSSFTAAGFGTCPYLPADMLLGSLIGPTLLLCESGRWFYWFLVSSEGLLCRPLPVTVCDWPCLEPAAMHSCGPSTATGSMWKGPSFTPRPAFPSPGPEAGQSKTQRIEIGLCLQAGC